MIWREDLAAELEQSGDYRILRRLKPRTVVNDPDGTVLLNGAVLDVETTGLDPKRDEIIELAIVPFTFSPDGRIFTVGAPWRRLRQPSIPIPAAIAETTGLDDAAVAGHAISPADIAAELRGTSVVVAHHAGFDRPFIDRFCGEPLRLCWACSMSEIDWRAEGMRSRSLEGLLAYHGVFYDAHRATDDCLALIELLARPLPKSGTAALAALLERARQTTWRIWATNSPFAAKDMLKARGYRWNPGDDGRPKSWFIDLIGAELREAEIAWLRDEIYRSAQACPPVDKLTAFERFREGF